MVLCRYFGTVRYSTVFCRMFVQSQVEERWTCVERQAGEDRTEPASRSTQSRHRHTPHITSRRYRQSNSLRLTRSNRLNDSYQIWRDDGNPSCGAAACNDFEGFQTVHGAEQLLWRRDDTTPPLSAVTNSGALCRMQRHGETRRSMLATDKRTDRRT